MKKKRAVIVGAGISGLTAGAYLLKKGHQVLILEQSSRCGGLVGSFEKDGFVFDAGPRAFGNAGILLPMLEDLRIPLPLVPGHVSTGIGSDIIHFDDPGAIQNFTKSLSRLFPESLEDICNIEERIRYYGSLVKTLNRVPNPFFKNPLKDWKFLLREFLPWLPSFLGVLIKTSRKKTPVEKTLESMTENSSLSDMLSQHFFKGTPAEFALGYFENYLDYHYPAGGTGELPRALEKRILSGGGIIKTNREVIKVLPSDKILLDQHGESHSYDSLLWAADLRSLYQRLDGLTFVPRILRSIVKEKQKYLSAPAGESVFTLFLGVNEAPEFFESISKGHLIYTPTPDGLGEIHRSVLDKLKACFSRISRQELFRWLKDFCEKTSYEISIPVLKDKSLAPPGKTGLVISMLVDGPLFLMVEEAGWMEEFRMKTSEHILDTLEKSLYPGLRKKILFMDTATPITLMKMFHTTDGAITGWSLEGKPPVPAHLAGIMSSVKTAIPHVYKSGQWSYSPSGVPIAILTGRIAAGAMDRSGSS